MKLFLNNVLTLIIFLIFPIDVLANGEDHPPGTPHTEEATSIDPVVAVVVVVAIIVAAFIVWKFVLKKKEAFPPNPK